MGNSSNILIEKLDAFIRKYYKNLLIRGTIYTVALSLIFYLAVVTLEYFGHFGSVARAILFYSFIIGTGYIVTRLIIIPLTKLYKLGKVISYLQAADIIGKHFADVKDKLLNTLQLQMVSVELAPSSSLLSASIDQRISELKPIPFTAAIDFKENRRYLKFAVVPLIIVFVLIFSAPNFIQEGTARILKHNTHFEIQAPFQFNILNDRLEAVMQENFELKVKLTGDEIPSNVMISIGENQYRLNRESNVEFTYLFRNVQQDIPFRLHAESFDSDEFNLSALPNPIVLNFNIELDYPDYTSKKDQVIKNTGDLIVPIGTEIRWTFNTKDTRSLKMSFNGMSNSGVDTSFLASIQNDNTFSYSNHFIRTTSYEIATENDFIKGKDPIQYAINVVPDLYPAIETEQFQDSLSSKRYFFRGMVKDDYGFNRLTFNYKYLNENNKARSASKEISVSKNSTQDQFFYAWNLNELEIEPGDQIEYFFEVWDNDGINGSKSSRTQSQIFKAPSKSELAASSDKNNKQMKDEMENTILEARQLQRDLDKLRKDLLQKKKPGWEDKKKMEDLLKKQKDLLDKVEEIKKNNEKNLRKEEEFSQTDQRIAEKNAQIRELFDELMTEDMKQMFNEIQELIDQMDKNKLQQTLEEIKMSSEEMEKELDRTLELFKQMEFEDKMNKAIEKLDELAEEQEKLSEESLDKKSDKNEIKEKQEKLNEEFKKLEKELESIEKLNEELEEPNKTADTKQEQKDIEDKMNESSEQLQKNQGKKASDSQKESSDKMKKMSQKMKDEMAQNQMENNQEDYNTLRSLLENLVKISFDQEVLMDQLGGIRQNDPQFAIINQKQKRLRDDTQMIQDSLFALSKRQPRIKSVVNKEISSINLNMSKAIEHLADRRTMQNARDASTRQQFAMTSINNLAFILDESLRQMQSDMASQMSGKQMCNSPKQGQGQKPGVKGLKQMQKALGDQLKNLKDGKNPGGKKGMSKALAKMAAEQEAIRNHLQKLSQELGDDGKGNKGDKGNYDEMKKMMEENEKDLVNKNITPETIRRQQEIMTRLLEAEKAERTRGEEEKRESEEAKNEDFSNPADFFEYNRLKLKEVELLKTVPPSLNSYYRKKVNDYFNSFNK